MKSITQFVAVYLMPALVSGCMCMMPMEKMDMGKVNMGQMDMGDKSRGHEMTGTKGEKTKIENRVGDLTVAFATIPAKLTVGENVLRVKLTDASGETIRDAVVTFDVAMTMPGMTAMEETAAVTKDVYQANTNFGMTGEWQITIKHPARVAASRLLASARTHIPSEPGVPCVRSPVNSQASHYREWEAENHEARS